MQKTKWSVVLGACLISAGLISVGQAANSEAVEAGPGEQTASIAGTYRGWDDMFSRDPYPNMGIRNVHRYTNAKPPRLSTDSLAWDDMHSRDPYPGMGVGTAHPMPASR